MKVDLSAEFLRVAQDAAIAAARTIGYGERKHSDHVAVEAMRKALQTVPIRGWSPLSTQSGIASGAMETS